MLNIIRDKVNKDKENELYTYKIAEFRTIKWPFDVE